MNLSDYSFFLFFLFVSSFLWIGTPLHAEEKKPLIIAHRGVSSQAPENTLSAFQKAIIYEADYFELDVRLSADGIPVVIHDAMLKRTTNSEKTVSSLTLNELKKLDAGSWFSTIYKDESIPSLEEVLALPRGKTGVMIEIKVENNEEITPLVTAVLSVVQRLSRDDIGPVILASFSSAVLQQVKKMNPTLPLMGLANTPSLIEEHLQLGITHLGLHQRLATAKRIHTLHSRKVLVWAYTIDDPRKMERLMHANINGIITNRLF